MTIWFEKQSIEKCFDNTSIILSQIHFRCWLSDLFNYRYQVHKILSGMTLNV